MTRPADLAVRIRTARETLGWSQSKLAAEVSKYVPGERPVHYRTVQGWEAGRSPRNAVPALERVLGVDLSSPTGAVDRVALDEATDAQLLAELAGRLSDRALASRDLRRDIERATADGDDPADVIPGRWAARDRDTPTE